MPFIISMIASLFASIWTRLMAFLLFSLPFILSKVLTLLGIGLVSYVGLDFLFEQLQDAVTDRFNNLPDVILSILTILGVLDGINMYFSTILAILGYKLSLSASKIVLNKNGSFKA